MKTYLRSVAPEDRELLAEKVACSVAYFYQIAGGHRKPSAKLCKKLIEFEPRLSLAELRPDIWT